MHLVAEVFELFGRQPPLQKSACVNARRRVCLEVDLIALTAFAATAKKVVEADLVESGSRGIGSDVPTDGGIVAIGAHHHDHGIPTQYIADATLDVVAAGIGWLLLGWNGIYVGRIGRKWNADAGLPGVYLQLVEQMANPFRARSLHYIGKGFEPFPGFDGFLVTLKWRQFFAHGAIPHPCGQATPGGTGLPVNRRPPWTLYICAAPKGGKFSTILSWQGISATNSFLYFAQSATVFSPQKSAAV